jgi:hypothetical protein
MAAARAKPQVTGPDEFSAPTGRDAAPKDAHCREEIAAVEAATPRPRADWYYPAALAPWRHPGTVGACGSRDRRYVMT